MTDKETAELKEGLKAKWNTVNKEYQTITHVKKYDTIGLKRKYDKFIFLYL